MIEYDKITNMMHVQLPQIIGLFSNQAPQIIVNSFLFLKPPPLSSLFKRLLKKRVLYILLVPYCSAHINHGNISIGVSNPPPPPKKKKTIRTTLVEFSLWKIIKYSENTLNMYYLLSHK